MRTDPVQRRAAKISQWALDPDRTRIDVVVRSHVVSGRRTRIRPLGGAMLWDEQRFTPYAITFEAGDETAPIRFVSSEVRFVDALRFDATGQLTIGNMIAAVHLRVHDLGWLPDPHCGRRRVFAVSATLDRRAWPVRKRRCLRRLLPRRDVDVVVHAEWVPDVSPAAA